VVEDDVHEVEEDDDEPHFLHDLAFFSCDFSFFFSHESQSKVSVVLQVHVSVVEHDDEDEQVQLEEVLQECSDL